MSWLATATDDDTVHVLPLDDLIVHEFGEDCPCGPRVQVEQRAASCDGYLIVHHALDNREAEEC